MHLMRTLDAYVHSEYIVVYIHTALSPENEPPLGWLRKVHSALIGLIVSLAGLAANGVHSSLPVLHCIALIASDPLLSCESCIDCCDSQHVAHGTKWGIQLA